MSFIVVQRHLNPLRHSTQSSGLRIAFLRTLPPCKYTQFSTVFSFSEPVAPAVPKVGLPKRATGLHGSVSHRVPQLLQHHPQQESHQQKKEGKKSKIHTHVPAPSHRKRHRGGGNQEPSRGRHQFPQIWKRGTMSFMGFPWDVQYFGMKCCRSSDLGQPRSLHLEVCQSIWYESLLVIIFLILYPSADTSGICCAARRMRLVQLFQKLPLLFPPTEDGGQSLSLISP